MKPIDGYFLITPDLSLIYPVDPKQRTKELDGVEWPPTEAVGQEAEATNVAAVDFAKFAHEWIADWNGHDLERILAHYCDDVELISPFVVKLTGKTEGVIRGKPALRDYFARGVEAFPTLRFEFVRHYSGVRSCVLEYRSVNRLRTAELMEFDEHGKVRRVLAHYANDTPDNHT